MKIGSICKMAVSAVLGVTLLLGSTVMGMSKVSAQAIEKEKSQKAIVVVSFGTTFADSRKACIESVENRIVEAFPEYDVYRAFTSKIVMKRLAERDNIHVNDLETTLNKLKQDGYKEVVVQTTHITPGEEYDKKVLATVAKFDSAFDKLVVGRPLLTFKGENGQTDDYAAVLEALKQQLPILKIKGNAVVFMGHGSPNQPNPVYQRMQEYFDAAGYNVVVGVVEESDHPNFEDAQKILKDRNVKNITLMPMMLVAGDHANNDMASEEDDSWKSVLTKQGYKVDTYIHGFGENAGIQDVYVQHVRDAINGVK